MILELLIKLKDNLLILLFFLQKQTHVVLKHYRICGISKELNKYPVVLLS